MTPIQINIDKNESLSSVANNLIPADSSDIAAVTSAAQAIGDLFHTARHKAESNGIKTNSVTGMEIPEDQHAIERRAKENGKRKQVRNKYNSLSLRFIFRQCHQRASSFIYFQLLKANCLLYIKFIVIQVLITHNLTQNAQPFSNIISATCFSHETRSHEVKS